MGWAGGSKRMRGRGSTAISENLRELFEDLSAEGFGHIAYLPFIGV
jgi:hypothetical protein